ncbi:MAG: fumarylacetoacetate hydrolase family protein [Glaciecola sp.]
MTTFKQSTIAFNQHALQPSKVVCVGRNYAAHIAELNNETPNEPVIFIKPNSAISHSLQTHPKDEIHYEAELALLIQNYSIAGIGIGLDLTKRDIQTRLKEKGLPWERAKAFDASVVFTDFVTAPNKLDGISFSLHINSELVQEGSYELMINKPARLLADITSFMRLIDNDIVLTGTPKGVGVVNKDDEFVVRLYQSVNHTKVELLTHTWLAK